MQSQQSQQGLDSTAVEAEESTESCTSADAVVQQLRGNAAAQEMLASRTGRDLVGEAAAQSIFDPAVLEALMGDPDIESAVKAIAPAQAEQETVQTPDVAAAYDWQSGPPGEMPVNMWLGIMAHVIHARPYPGKYTDHEVYSNYIPLSSIVKKEGGDPDGLDNPALKPDVYVGSGHGAVVELKHRNSAGTAAGEA